jgi:hypothetical protein
MEETPFLYVRVEARKLRRDAPGSGFDERFQIGIAGMQFGEIRHGLSPGLPTRAG